MHGYDYSSAGAYFVTIVAFERAYIFGDVVEGQMHLNAWGEILHQEWLRAEELRSNVSLDMFQVKSNHIHGLIEIGDSIESTEGVNVVGQSVGAIHRVALETQPNGPKEGSLGAIIGQFKSRVTKQIILQLSDATVNRATQRVAPTGIRNIWQRNYYDHIIRNESELDRIRQYIVENPARWEIDREGPGEGHRI